MVIMLRLGHVVYRVVLVADAAEHEAADGFVKRDLVMTVDIGHHALVDDFPVDIDTGKWGSFAVFRLFVDGAFDEALGKCGVGEGKKQE